MRIKIGTPYKNFYFDYKRKKGETDLTWHIRTIRKNKKINIETKSGSLMDIASDKIEKRYLWIHYSNVKSRSRAFGKHERYAKYHLCIQIPGLFTIDTAHLGKKLWGHVYLTRLFNKDYCVYSNSEEVTQDGKSTQTI